jgi:hypothetical protein
MPHANAINGVTVYVEDGAPLPADEDYFFDFDGFAKPGIRQVGPGILMEYIEPDIQVGS